MMMSYLHYVYFKIYNFHNHISNILRILKAKLLRKHKHKETISHKESEYFMWKDEKEKPETTQITVYTKYASFGH